MINDTSEVQSLESIINEHDHVMNSKIITEDIRQYNAKCVSKH